jgi:SAM-dependent methyltransferase
MLLRLPNKPEVPVVDGPMDTAVARYELICGKLLAELGPNPVLTDKVMCEAGAGDGLAVAALLISLGARKVQLVELNPPVATKRQVEILEQLQKKGLPLRPDAVLEAQPLRLKDAVVYHQCFMEEMDTVAAFDLIFSNSVLEHVEDVDTFFGRCFRSLKPGSRMIHCIDLGGHASFEDPMPPLEFQIYPDWLFWLMSPPFNRATRRAVGEYVQFAKSVGFTNVVVKPTRLADPAYLEAVWPRLNRRIRRAGKAGVAVVEFILIADKPQ